MEMQNGQPVPTSPQLHFGYTDGISMTTIGGGPAKYHPDHQRPCEPWPSLREDAENYVVPEPRKLGLNGSFAVFKKVETDVVGFENFLQSNKDKIDPELLAAKMCGDCATAFLSLCHRTRIARREGFRPNSRTISSMKMRMVLGDPEGILAVPSAHTFAASIRAVNRSQARGNPAAAIILTALFVAVCLTGRPMIQANLTMASSAGFCFISLTQTSRTNEFVLRRWVNDAEFAEPSGLTPSRKIH